MFGELFRSTTDPIEVFPVINNAPQIFTTHYTTRCCKNKHKHAHTQKKTHTHAHSHTYTRTQVEIQFATAKVQGRLQEQHEIEWGC